MIAAVEGKAKRINVIMPFLYEGRQHKRSGRESLDCAYALTELAEMGVTNFITFDAHDPRVQNATPLCGFDNFTPPYQFMRALLDNVPDLIIDKDHMMVISPDEGALDRTTYFANVLGVNIGMFYKRRDYSVIVNGKNPIVAHEFLGDNIDGKDITFLDTPGHAAFTTMRARGAMVTDIAVLVVAADDGIMPQTVEAINHAKAAGVSIIVAINKMDKPAANPDLVKQQLTEYELVPEEWGGDVPCIPVSAHTKMGIDDLLEMILLVAEMKELKANPDRAAKGTVIEARLDKGRGPVATVLVQNGTLHTGDIVVAGTTVGRIRAMMNERGERVKSAGPSVPVEVTGLNEVPVGGDTFNAVSDERLARELVEQRLTEQKEEMFNSQTKVTLDNLFEQMKEGEMKELKVIVKADVQGSVEAVRQSLEKLSNDEVRVHVIHGAVGAISESDVMLANASNAIIVGFNVRPDPVAEENAKRDGVDMRLYRIIYDCIEEIESAMKGMLAPKYREVFLGKAECREVYKITNVGMVIGGHVTSGKIVRGAQVRLVRDGIIVADDKIASLRRFKDDVKEVQDGYDCGITLERFSDIKLGDILEAYEMEEYRD